MKLSRIVVLIVAVAVACPLPAAGAPAAGSDSAVVGELMAALEKFDGLRTWRARMSLVGQNSPPMVISSAGRDRMQVTIGTAPNAQHIYVLDGVGTWAQQGNQCAKLPGSAPGLPSRADADPSARRDGTITVTRGAPETIDGTPTRTYMMTVEYQGKTSGLKYYIDPALTLPKRMESQSERGTVILDYYDYNAPIVVNNPPC